MVATVSEKGWYPFPSIPQYFRGDSVKTKMSDPRIWNDDGARNIEVAVVVFQWKVTVVPL